MTNWFTLSGQWFRATSAIAILTFNLLAHPILASNDPFRTTSSYKLDANTEAAFKAIFQQGDYRTASNYLQQAETKKSTEPLTYAMIASLAYVKEDWESFGIYATKTREMAENLISSDPLRGNLYTAVGHFLEGAYNLEQQGLVRGVPQALSKLQQVSKSFQNAEKIDPEDPELNLIKGYMDLMLAVTLPFANPAEAIERLENYGAPTYLVSRGIALGYRDLNNYEKAQEYLDRAIAETPDNPELHYLKAQVLVKLKQREQAGKAFNLALADSTQLPKRFVAQIFYEQCKNQNKIDDIRRDCDDLRDPIREENEIWGPKTLPPLTTSSPLPSPSPIPQLSPIPLPPPSPIPKPLPLPQPSPTPQLSPIPLRPPLSEETVEPEPQVKSLIKL